MLRPEALHASRYDLTDTAQRLGTFMRVLGYPRYADMLEAAGDEVPPEGIDPEEFSALAQRVGDRFEEVVGSEREDFGSSGAHIILALGDAACGPDFYAAAVDHTMRVEQMWDELSYAEPRSQ